MATRRNPETSEVCGIKSARADDSPMLWNREKYESQRVLKASAPFFWPALLEVVKPRKPIGPSLHSCFLWKPKQPGQRGPHEALSSQGDQKTIATYQLGWAVARTSVYVAWNKERSTREHWDAFIEDQEHFTFHSRNFSWSSFRAWLASLSFSLRLKASHFSKKAARGYQRPSDWNGQMETFGRSTFIQVQEVPPRPCGGAFSKWCAKHRNHPSPHSVVFHCLIPKSKDPFMETFFPQEYQFYGMFVSKTTTVLSNSWKGNQIYLAHSVNLGSQPRWKGRLCSFACFWQQWLHVQRVFLSVKHNSM